MKRKHLPSADEPTRHGRAPGGKDNAGQVDENTRTNQGTNTRTSSHGVLTMTHINQTNTTNAQHAAGRGREHDIAPNDPPHDLPPGPGLYFGEVEVDWGAIKKL